MVAPGVYKNYIPVCLQQKLGQEMKLSLFQKSPLSVAPKFKEHKKTLKLKEWIWNMFIVWKVLCENPYFYDRHPTGYSGRKQAPNYCTFIE